MTILRLILAPILGLIVFGATVSGIQAIGHQAYPVPPAITDLSEAYGQAMLSGDQAEVARIGEALSAEMGTYLETAPIGALLFVVFAWIAGAFLGGGIAAVTAPFARVPMALAIGLADVAAIVLVTSQLPHPLWMPIAGIGGAVIASLLAGLVVSKMRRPSPQAKKAD